jgi:pimeloyl-ACP methyl ester carboxylesterase
VKDVASQQDTVMLLHAAVVSRHELFLLGRRLKGMGFAVHCPGYPNRRLNMWDCAEYLRPVFRDICDAASGRVHLAGHSMGGLVARRLLALHQPLNFGRLVTFGTPHGGSPLADALHQYAWYQKLFGPAGQDLVTGRPLDWIAPWPPPYEIGLIAGSVPVGPGSFHLPRPSDGTVPQASAQPPGGTDYALVPATHTTIPFLKQTARLTANFFRTGHFAG